eukprot:79888-Prymnesium_polylepis.1
MLEVLSTPLPMRKIRSRGETREGGLSRARRKPIIDTQGNQDLVTLFSDAPPLGAGHFFQQGLLCLNHL